MESGGLGDVFGDPEELQRRLAEFAEQMQGQQRLAWADNAIKLAVDMTVAAIARINLQGNADAQAEQIRAVMASVFPEAVTLVQTCALPICPSSHVNSPSSPPSRSASRDARPAKMTSLKERKRKMNTTAPSPAIAVKAAIASCCPTE